MEPDPSLDPSSVAWASTAGVIDPEVGNPSHFIEAEQSPASAAAQDTGDADATPGDRAAATPDVDVSVMVSGNSEEGTHNEAATAATQARFNTVEDKPLVQAPTDATGGREDRLAGTGSTETSTEPFTYSASGESDQATRDDEVIPNDTPPPDRNPSAAASEAPEPSAPPQAPSNSRQIRYVRREPNLSATSDDLASASIDSGKTGSSSSTSAPLGDDGLPIYFDTDDTNRSAAQSSDLGGLKDMDDFPAVAGERNPGEAAGSRVDDERNQRRPEPGSSIPNFATDADKPTRIVESPARTGNETRTSTGSESVSNAPEDAYNAGQASSGVPMRERTSRSSSDVELLSDPALGRARPGDETGRRGSSGLGAGTGSAAGPGSFDDVQVADVVSSENAGTAMGSPDAVTEQDAAGALDTKDPEGISRRVTRDAGSTNSGSTSSGSSRGRSRRQRRNRSDDRSGR